MARGAGSKAPVRVSVVLPTYNRSATLPAAIASVLSQSIDDLELIVVDDHSSEDIAGLVHRLANPRIRYLRRSANGGAAAARNSGLALARGRYIAFQDSDDLWLPRKLERQIGLLERAPAAIGVVTGPKIYYGRDGRMSYGAGKVSITPAPKNRLPLDCDQVAHLLGDNRLSVQCALFRAGCMAGAPWFDERARANEDWEFAVRLAQRTRIYEDAEPVAIGFVSPDSISMRRRPQAIGELRVLKNNRALLERYPRQRAVLMLDVGRMLARSGKPRLGTRFILAGLLDDPLSGAMSLAGTFGRRLRSPLGLGRFAAPTR